MAASLSPVKTTRAIYNESVVKVKTIDITKVPFALKSIGLIIIIGAFIAAYPVWSYSGCQITCLSGGSVIFIGGIIGLIGVWKDKKIQEKLDLARSYYGRRLELQRAGFKDPKAAEIYHLQTFLMLHETRKIPYGYLWRGEKDGREFYMVGTSHDKIIKKGEENELLIHPTIKDLIQNSTDLFLEGDLEDEAGNNLLYKKDIRGYENIFFHVDGLDLDLGRYAKRHNVRVHTAEPEKLAAIKREKNIYEASNDDKTLHVALAAIDMVQWNRKPPLKIPTKMVKEDEPRDRHFTDLILENFKNPDVKPIFAFGTAHFELNGETGIISLLKKEGFTVTLIPLQ